MMSHHKNVSAGVLRRYTLIEVLVVISILATLMAISSNVAVKSRKSVVAQFSKVMPSVAEKADGFGSEDAETKEGQTKSKREKGPGVRQNLAKAGILRDNPSGKGKNAAVQAPVSIPDKKIAVLRNQRRVAAPNKITKTAAVPNKKTKTVSEPAELDNAVDTAEETAAVVFPDPEGIVPGETIITISAADAPETEAFAKFLHRKGSSGTMKEYRQQWTVDLNVLKAEKKFKLEHGMEVPLFSQYLRSRTVFETSPYRTYVLRKKLLLASRQAFDPEKSALKYKAMAEKKFKMVQKGDFIRLTDVRGRKRFGVYQGTDRQQILFRRGNTTSISLGLVPNDQRWRYDETALQTKREAYVKQFLSREEEQIRKQDEYIRKTLEAEFIMLKKDPMMANIR